MNYSRRARIVRRARLNAQARRARSLYVTSRIDLIQITQPWHRPPTITVNNPDWSEQVGPRRSWPVRVARKVWGAVWDLVAEMSAR